MDEVLFYRGQSRPVDRQPYFFYHIPKTGGMSFHTLAHSCWRLVAAQTGVPAVVARLDSLAEARERMRTPSVLLSTHLPYGIHRQLPGEPRLVTFLRDPVDRVRSAYTYSRMRSGRRATVSEFLLFAQEEENRNAMTKQLAGVGEDYVADRGDLETAQDNLLHNFYMFDAIDHAKPMFEHYIAVCGLFNVISNRINQTTAPYRIDAQQYRAAVAEQNRLDVELFDWVRANARLPQDAVNRPLVHPTTVVIAEFEFQSGNGIDSIHLPTQQLLDMGTIDLALNVNRQAFDRLVDDLKRKHEVA